MLSGAWVWTAADPTRDAPNEPVPTAPADEAPVIERVRIHTLPRNTTAAGDRQVLRDPFAFGARPPERRSTSARRRLSPSLRDDPQTVPGAPGPALELIGTSWRSAFGETRRTAILADHQDGLHFAQDGDTLFGRYRVRVGPSAAQLTDLTSGTAVCLVLAGHGVPVAGELCP